MVSVALSPPRTTRSDTELTPETLLSLGRVQCAGGEGGEQALGLLLVGVVAQQLPEKVVLV